MSAGRVLRSDFTSEAVYGGASGGMLGPAMSRKSQFMSFATCSSSSGVFITPGT